MSSWEVELMGSLGSALGFCIVYLLFVANRRKS